MSRSYKHTPYCGDPKDKYFKRYANKRIRQKKLIHNFHHKSYRKDFCYYDICDYYWIETKNFDEYYEYCINQWKHDVVCSIWCKKKSKPTREECWKFYQKYYKRK